MINSPFLQKTKTFFKKTVVVNYALQSQKSASKLKHSAPTASSVLTSYLKQRKEPPWTSYFIRYIDIEDDQFGMSHFNWKVGNSNYHILRTGCFPYIKYHCTKRPYQDLSVEDLFFRLVKLMNLGIPCLLYGIAAIMMISHSEIVNTPNGRVTIFFLIPENKDSNY
ncbi:uncharacterized protein C15orf61 homolog isoform X2 [Agrilus planipennis]|nr:uncharacterized protein C15orf61 homolog isoform X2 [Agrilus planipennis]